MSMTQMMIDLEVARQYSRDHGTVYAASNGEYIIWDTNQEEVNRPGSWIAAVFEDGRKVEA